MLRNISLAEPVSVNIFEYEPLWRFVLKRTLSYRSSPNCEQPIDDEYFHNERKLSPCVERLYSSKAIVLKTPKP